MYDAIVIGARCAGSPTAMLLARKGYRVLLVDRATFPSDTISTHYLWPMGSSYLERWGLLQTLLATTPSSTTFTVTVEGITLDGRPPDEDMRRRMRELHGDDRGVVDRFVCARRRVLDKLLRDAAECAGAEVREGFSVEELTVENGRVTGIKGRTANGQRVTESARVVVGADGRHSLVARALALPTVRERNKCTFAYYSYYSGLSPDGLIPMLHIRGRLKVAYAATNDDLHLVLAFGPVEWFADFKKDIEGNYLKIFDRVYPALAQRLRDGARREERIYGTADQPNNYRRASGPGWALVGDAAYTKDQCTAIGITHAFRGAELLVSHLDEGLSGRKPLDAALDAYARRQVDLAEEYLDFVAAQAEMNAPSLPELQLARAMRGNPRHIDRFIGTFGDLIPARQFFAPDNLDEIMASAKEGPDRYPIFTEYESRQIEYVENPFVS